MRPRRYPTECDEDDLFGPEPDAAPVLVDVAPPPMPPVPPPANNWIPIGPSVLRQGQGGNAAVNERARERHRRRLRRNRVYAAAANGGVWRSDEPG